MNGNGTGYRLGSCVRGRADDPTKETGADMVFNSALLRQLQQGQAYITAAGQVAEQAQVTGLIDRVKEFILPAVLVAVGVGAYVWNR